MKTVYLIYAEPSGGLPYVFEVWGNSDGANNRRDELQENKKEPGQTEKLWCDYRVEPVDVIESECLHPIVRKVSQCEDFGVNQFHYWKECLCLTCGKKWIEE